MFGFQHIRVAVYLSLHMRVLAPTPFDPERFLSASSSFMNPQGLAQQWAICTSADDDCHSEGVPLFIAFLQSAQPQLVDRFTPNAPCRARATICSVIRASPSLARKHWQPR